MGPIWNCRAWLAGRRTVVTWPYIHTIVSPMTKVGTTGGSSYSPEGVATPLVGQIMGMNSWWQWLMAMMLERGPS